MKRYFFIVLTVLLLLISESGSAADVYACTRTTPQGAVFEYYIREESCRVIIDKEQILCADIITVRKDKWGRTVPPLIVEWRFLNVNTQPVFVKYDKKTGRATERNAVGNDPVARQILEKLKEVVSS